MVSIRTDEKVVCDERGHEFVTLDFETGEVICLECGILEKKSNCSEIDLKKIDIRDKILESGKEISKTQWNAKSSVQRILEKEG